MYPVPHETTLTVLPYVVAVGTPRLYPALIGLEQSEVLSTKYNVAYMSEII